MRKGLDFSEKNRSLELDGRGFKIFGIDFLLSDFFKWKGYVNWIDVFLFYIWIDFVCVYVIENI